MIPTRTRDSRLERLRARLSFANVVSCLALFVALGGTSYAVVKLPRNSVGSREVKDHSLGAVDLETGLPRGPRGQQGPAGPAGQGPAGPAGPRGPSNVVTASRNQVPMSLGGPSSVDVVTLSLPAGSWSIVGSASVVFFGPGSDFFRCQVFFDSTGGTSGSVVRIGADAGAALGSALVVQESRVLPGPTAVRLRCGHDSTLAAGTPRADHAQLTATRTETVEIQPG